MNLSTPFEVLKYSPAGLNYPSKDFCILIPVIEESFKNDCLGADLYDFMVSKLNPYPEVFSEWDSLETYDTDDVVVRNNCTFISTADNNSNDPLTGTNWDSFLRFNHEGANLLWEKYLRQIFAIKVFIFSLTPSTYSIGAAGVTVNSGDNTGTRAANKTEILTLINEQEGILSLITKNMLIWLDNNAANFGLPYVSCEKKCTTVKRSRRWGFR